MKQINEEIAMQGVAQEKPCIMSHEEMYLTWCHQSDGYSYFKCTSCSWQKPDLELGTVGKLFKAKDLRYQEMMGKLEKVREALIESRKCMDSDHTLSSNYGRAWNLGNNALTLLSEIMKEKHELPK